MTQEEKELLLKDLSARLPYGVKVWYKYYPDNITEKFATSIRLVDDKLALSNKLNKEGNWYPIEEAGEILIKPYLRPLSSMTEEEYDDMFSQIYSAQEEFFRNCSNIDTIGKIIANDSVRYDWLNKKMFDYRGLIPKGLALKKPEGMYELPLTFK